MSIGNLLHVMNVVNCSDYCICVYCSCIIHLWDLHHDGLWENHSIYSHYTDFLLEMIALSVDLMHHLHMIVSTAHAVSLILLYVIVVE